MWADERIHLKIRCRYGLEALVSTIDDKDDLVKALKAASDRCSIFKRQA